MDFNIYNTLSELMVLADKAANLFYVQDIFNGLKCHKKIINILTAQSAISKRLTSCIAGLLDNQEAKDYIGMADCYSMQLKPMCEAIINELRNDGIWQEVRDYYKHNYAVADEQTRAMLDSINAGDEDIPEGYELVETAVGSFALKVRLQEASSQLILSSLGNPYNEAEMLVDAYCSDSTTDVTLLGLGMGYIARALAERADITHTDVYEVDSYVIKAAFHYADLAKVLKDGRVSVIYDPQLIHFSKKLATHNSEIIIHRPSMMNIKDVQLRTKIEDFFLHDNSVRSQWQLLFGNFQKNMGVVGVEALDSLEDIFTGKQMLFIAGGPSLEDHIDMLVESTQEYVVTVYHENGVSSYPLKEYLASKEMLPYVDGVGGNAVSENDAVGCANDEYIVVCAGTVLKKLISYGIKPDYVVMTDAQDNMMSQVSGVDTSDLALIYIPTLYYGVPANWKGKLYMGLQAGFESSEKEAKRLGRRLFETGGSVSTFALDMGLKLGCDKIVCLGLDLAFVDNKRHAGDAAMVGFDEASFRKVKSVDGDDILTSNNLDNYRLWIERRLANRTQQERSVELVNVSRGAFIKGMINRTEY